MPPLLTLRGREGILHVRPAHALDSTVANELQTVLSRIPLSVPIILDLADSGVYAATELGVVMSFARVASAKGHTIAITVDDDMRDQLTGVGVDRMVVMGASTEECERRLTLLDLY